jgi:hypothetical protein
MRQYTIGITIWVHASGELGLYENGLRQNVLFLYNMFRASPACKRVYLLNHGEGEPGPIPPEYNIPAGAIVRNHQVDTKLDYVLVVGAAIDAATVSELREKGTRIISYKGGNGIVISMEAIIANPPKPAERYFDCNFYDAIWMTPQHIHTYRTYCELIYRCPVFEVPQVWQPIFLEARFSALQIPFGYKPGPQKKRVGILDPNITVMKTSHLPMLVCESAYRRRPELFQAVYVTNAIQLQQNLHFTSFASRLKLTQDKLLTVEPRFVTADFLAHHADAVVTHHWENGLNYLYYDVLNGGYPLVHNSEFLADFGYYYESFDAESGGDALIRALADHDRRYDEYCVRSAHLLQRVNAIAPHNIALHEKLLAELDA